MKRPQQPQFQQPQFQQPQLQQSQLQQITEISTVDKELVKELAIQILQNVVLLQPYGERIFVSVLNLMKVQGNNFDRALEMVNTATKPQGMQPLNHVNGELYGLEQFFTPSKTSIAQWNVFGKKFENFNKNITDKAMQMIEYDPEVAVFEYINVFLVLKGQTMIDKNIAQAIWKTVKKSKKQLKFPVESKSMSIEDYVKSYKTSMKWSIKSNPMNIMYILYFFHTVRECQVKYNNEFLFDAGIATRKIDNWKNCPDDWTMFIPRQGVYAQIVAFDDTIKPFEVINMFTPAIKKAFDEELKCEGAAGALEVYNNNVNKFKNAAKLLFLSDIVKYDSYANLPLAQSCPTITTIYCNKFLFSQNTTALNNILKVKTEGTSTSDRSYGNRDTEAKGARPFGNNNNSSIVDADTDNNNSNQQFNRGGYHGNNYNDRDNRYNNNNNDLHRQNYNKRQDNNYNNNTGSQYYGTNNNVTDGTVRGNNNNYNKGSNNNQKKPQNNNNYKNANDNNRQSTHQQQHGSNDNNVNSNNNRNINHNNNNNMTKNNNSRGGTANNNNNNTNTSRRDNGTAPAVVTVAATSIPPPQDGAARR